MKRLAEVREVAGRLREAREQLYAGGGDPEPLALGILEAAWQIRVEPVPAVLVADLITEAWTVLAENALNRGSLERCELALSTAEAAAMAGRGDPQVAGHLHLGWAFYHRAAGSPDQARAALDLLARVAEAIQDPPLLAEAELWIYLFEREQGRDREAQEAFRRAGARLPADERPKLLSRLVTRLKSPARGSVAEPAPAADPRGLT